MTRPKIFCAGEIEPGKTIIVEGEECAYLGRVLRLRPGDSLEVIDETRKLYPALIREFAGKKALLEIAGEGMPVFRDMEITLVQGVIRLNNMDSLVEKAAEMGVKRIVPLFCRRSLPPREGGGAYTRVERWRRLAREAARKVGRGFYPEIEFPIFWDDFLTDLPGGDAKLIFWEEERRQSLKDLLCSSGCPGKTNFTIILGPEGGFTPEEVAQAVEAGFLPVSLGSQVFTVETALMVILSVLHYERGSLGSLNRAGEGK